MNNDREDRGHTARSVPSGYDLHGTPSEDRHPYMSYNTATCDGNNVIQYHTRWKRDKIPAPVIAFASHVFDDFLWATNFNYEGPRKHDHKTCHSLNLVTVAQRMFTLCAKA